MKYDVLISFTEAQQKTGDNVYWRGQTYPRAGFTPTKERVDYLTSDKTRFKKPVIKLSTNKEG